MKIFLFFSVLILLKFIDRAATPGPHATKDVTQSVVSPVSRVCQLVIKQCEDPPTTSYTGSVFLLFRSTCPGQAFPVDTLRVAQGCTKHAGPCTCHNVTMTVVLDEISRRQSSARTSGRAHYIQSGLSAGLVPGKSAAHTTFSME